MSPQRPNNTQVAGQSVGSVVGAGLGTAVGGPIGGPIGSTVGGATGSFIGQQASKPAGAVGVIAGSVFGPFGSAVGGYVGNAFSNLGGDKRVQQETERRTGVLNSFRDIGVFDRSFSVTLPDGSTYKGDTGDRHSWRNPGRKGDGPDRELHDYEIDYTNDLDYVAGMAGITLSRVLNGETNKAVDQAGNKLGNIFLGKLGHGKDLTGDAFNQVMNNARATYGKQGIKSKEDLLALANTMYGDGRINDFDRGVMQQTASLVFDNDFGTAQQLMGGRDKGLGVAHRTPSNGGALPQNKPGRIYSPVLSPEEAFLSVQPFFDEYNRKFPGRKPSKSTQTVANISQAAGAISAAAGAFKDINDKTGGKLGEYVKGGLQALGESLGIIGPDLEIAEIPTPVVSSGLDVGSLEGIGSAISQSLFA